MYTKFSKLAVAALLVWASCTSAQIFAAAPVITSPLTDSVIVGQPYSYTITASNAPSSYTAAGLPSNLARAGAVISGTPTVSGMFDITVGAWNADGFTTEKLLLTVEEENHVVVSPNPEIISETTLFGTVGEVFGYAIETDIPVTSYEAIGIESYPGLSFDALTGVISGTPTEAVSGDLILKASIISTIPGAANADPVTQLAFNETTGTVAADSTGNGNNASLVSGPTWGLGNFGNAVDLDGVNDHVTLPAGIVSSLTDFTISAWVNLNTVTEWSRIFDFGSTGSNHMFLTPSGGGTIVYGISNSGNYQAISGTLPVPAGEWAHVAVTLSGSTGTLYLNGEAIGSDTITMTPSVMGDTPNNYLGRAVDNDTYVDGRFDEFQIYDYALTPEEVVAIGVAPGYEDIEVATLTVVSSAAAPVVNSPSIVSGRVGNPFTYQILASASPTSYSATGLSAIPGLSLDAQTGVISGIPELESNAVLTISASNAFGSDAQSATVTILAELPVPTVVITSPVVDAVLESTDQQVTITAEVTPASGETIERVFASWNIDPQDPDSPYIIVAELAAMTTDPITGAITYSGTAALGVNPRAREIGGGSNQIEVVAYHASAESDDDVGSDVVEFTVKPFLEMLYPTELLSVGVIEAGDSYASVRVNTNTFYSITSRIAGSGVLDSMTTYEASENGVFNFAASQTIEFPGLYDIHITVEDLAGNTAVIEQQILVSDTIAKPVAELVTPAPGYRTEIFTPAVLSIVNGEVEIVNGGQGYYPRNASGQKLGVTLTSGFEVSAGDSISATIKNGRITSVSGTLDEGISGQAVIDLAVSNPGIYSRIPITAQFFQASAELVSFNIFVNGVDVTPGDGEFSAGDLPLLKFPRTGSPALGDYVVVAQVTDAQGQIGVSVPLSFSIVPYEPIAVTLSRETTDDVMRGESVTFLADLSPLSSIVGVEFFDSDTNELLGEGTSVALDDGTDYIFTRTFNVQGNVGTYAKATAFDDRTAMSSPIRLDIQPSDISVAITKPATDQTIVVGESLSFTAVGTGTLDTSSVEWFINGTSVSESDSSPYIFESEFTDEGTYTVTAVATDLGGNTSPLSDEMVVTVEALDAVLRESDFVMETFTAILGRAPNQADFDEYLPQLDETFESRVAVIVDLLDSDRIGNMEIAALIYRTMTGEWPSPEELQQALNDLQGASSRTELLTGSIASFGAATFPVNLAANFSVTVSVTPDTTNSNPLNDATLAILSPSGGLLAFNDDFNGLNPQITFIPTLAGEYTIVVGGWGSSQGDFNVNVVTTNPGGAGLINPNALTTALIPEYEARFSSLNTDVGFVTQLFKNKHGETSISAFNEIRLYNAAQGGSIDLTNGQTIPGYNGDLVTFATQFALDNDVSGFSGPSGQSLSNFHLYAMPNDATADLRIALLLSSLLEVEPTIERIAAYSALTLEETVSLILLEYLGLDLPTPLADATSLGDNWFYLDWFGYFSYDATASADWVYSLDFGWIYIASTEATNGFWFWSDAMSSWSWATETSPSWIYRWSDSTWVYVLSVDGGGSWLNPRSTGIWEQLSL